MKKRTQFILCAALFCATSFSEDRNFVLAGQSNMHGKGNPAELTEEEKCIPPNVTVLVSNIKWDIHGSMNFGMEVGFVRGIGKLYPDDDIFL